MCVRFTLLIILLLAPQKKTDAQKHTQKQIQPPTVNQTVSDSPSPKAVPVTQFNTYNHQSEGGEETVKIVSDILLALFTGGLVVVGLQQAKILRKHEEWMQKHDANLAKLADAAERNGKALMDAERPWVVVDDVKLIPIIGVAGEERTVTFDCHVRNYGRSPAIITVVRCKLESRASQDASDAPLSEEIYSAADDAIHRIVAPPQKPFSLRSKHDLTLSAAQSKAIWYGAPFEFMFAHGIIRYEDAFGRKLYTRFNYRFEAVFFDQTGAEGFVYSERPPGWNAWT